MIEILALVLLLLLNSDPPEPDKGRTSTYNRVLQSPPDCAFALNTLMTAALLHLEDYLDTIESLPLELSRNFTLLRELDAMAQENMTKVEKEIKDFLANMQTLPVDQRENALTRIAASFKQSLKHGEEKVALAVQTYDMVDRHIRRLDEDLSKFEEEQMTGPKLMSDRKDSDPQRARVAESIQQGTPAKKRKLNTKDEQQISVPTKQTAVSRAGDKNGKTTKKNGELKGQGQISLVELPIDPNEPLYCLCNQVSYGNMIACDNDDCEIEWFHLGCVGLSATPKGKWYCPTCSDSVKR
ncbi:hypothetical protein SeLEV6574_g04903 [Synchytrium endobioticum]|uniref:Chromatin modification-related protein n=2 Tax=Synchytrium endobioticum TaxID=286115 RepID=A0A507CXD9_9FUNG|nr:hypothetical protein SeLEV6574_g04903 [Synchytrium endobioticum]